MPHAHFYRFDLLLQGLNSIITSGIGWKLLRICFAFKLNPIDHYTFEICVSCDAFHAIVTDFFGIQIAAVTFSAADTFPVI